VFNATDVSSHFAALSQPVHSSTEEWRYFQKVLLSAPLSQKAFVATTLLHISLLLIERVYSTIYAYAAYAGKDATDVQLDEVWMLTMMFATAVFMAWFGIESIVKANAFEIGAYVGTSAFLMIRQLSDYVCYLDNSSTSSETLNCGSPGLSIAVVHILFATTTLLNVVELGLCVIMVPDLRWTKYKAIGSDNTVRGLYKRYELFSSVRKMDLQFSVLLVISGLVFFSHKTQDQETGLAPTALLAVTELVWDRVGVHAIKKGDEWAVYMFWALSLILPMYVSSVAFVSFDNDNAYFDELRRGQDGSERPDRLTKVAVLAIACVLNRISTVVVSLLLYQDFGSDKYKALQRLFSLGFKKYGVQRLGGEASGGGTELTSRSRAAPGVHTNVVNPLDEVLSVHSTAHPVSKTAQERLAAMYAVQQETADEGSFQPRSSFVVSTASTKQSRAPSVRASSRDSLDSRRQSVSFDLCNEGSTSQGGPEPPATAHGATEGAGGCAASGADGSGNCTTADAHAARRAFLDKVREKLPNC